MGRPLTLKSGETKNGVRSFGLFAVFRLRSDPHGVKILKSAFSGKFVSMLTQLWQLDSVGVETLENSVPHMTTFASEVFSQGFLNGIVHFAREYTSLIEEEYLTGYEDATAKCYVRLHSNLSS